MAVFFLHYVDNIHFCEAIHPFGFGFSGIQCLFVAGLAGIPDIPLPSGAYQLLPGDPKVSPVQMGFIMYLPQGDTFRIHFGSKFKVNLHLLLFNFTLPFVLGALWSNVVECLLF